MAAVLSSVCRANSTDCSFHLYVGFSGSDRWGSTFNSNFQLTRVNQYSITSLYDKTTSTVCCPDPTVRYYDFNMRFARTLAVIRISWWDPGHALVVLQLPLVSCSQFTGVSLLGLLSSCARCLLAGW